MPLYQPFKALAQGRADYEVEVIRIDHPANVPFMVICATEEAVYITKEQVMKFFGLVEASNTEEHY